MKNMIFSVIIPVYNVEKYLPECVNSVLNQDFYDYEVILVDDGSTDSSGNICDEYAKEYSNIKVIHKENGGLSDARNFGIKEAKGEYLMFLDSDDFWYGIDVLSGALDTIRTQNNPDLILFGITDYYPDREAVQKVFPQYKMTGKFFSDFRYLNDMLLYKATACDKIIKRKLITDNKLFFLKGKTHEDIAWSIDIIPHIDTYVFYPKNLYMYRKNREGSITYVVKPQSVIDIINIMCKRKDYLSTIEGGNQFLAYVYVTYLWHINILSNRKMENLRKMETMIYLLNNLPSQTPRKTKIKAFVYKLFGLKFTGYIEYKVRLLLEKLKTKGK